MELDSYSLQNDPNSPINQEPIDPDIQSISFSKEGVLFISGWINAQYIEVEIHDGQPEFEQIKPKIEEQKVILRDDEGLYNAALDKFKNLHWLVELVSGQIIERSVRIEDIAKEFLINKYTK